MANYRGRGRPNNKANSPVRMATTERRRLAAAMYVKGMTQSQIAAELGVSVSRVSGDLKQIREEWRKEYLDKYDGLAIEQLRKLEAVEQEAWEAWHNSKGGKSGPNAKFINLVLKSIERRCK